MATYLRPTTVDAVLDALGGARFAILAGGTDFYPARVGKALDDDVLDISAVRELRGIRPELEHWRIGATTTWTDMLEADLPPLFDGLKLAGREVGGMQIQNAGTICGNLCNGSPAADGVPPLLALGAQVEIRSKHAIRAVPLDQFILGNRKTAITAHEMVTAVLIPRPASHARSHFLKLGARRYLVISIAMVAATLETSADNVVTAARVAVGACSPVARRLPLLEHALIGTPLDARIADRVQPVHLGPVAPIDDVRASKQYRLDATVTLLQRLLRELSA